MTLIDKSALVAEIKNRRDNFYSLSKSCEKGTPAKAGFYAQAQTLEGILSFIDTIETKEVNLEKEVKDYIYTLPHSRTGIPGGWKCSWNEEEVIKIVKHFLEIK